MALSLYRPLSLWGSLSLSDQEILSRLCVSLAFSLSLSLSRSLSLWDQGILSRLCRHASQCVLPTPRDPPILPRERERKRERKIEEEREKERERERKRERERERKRESACERERAGMSDHPQDKTSIFNTLLTWASKRSWTSWGQRLIGP